jgi:hypothetical protein
LPMRFGRCGVVTNIDHSSAPSVLWISIADHGRAIGPKMLYASTGKRLCLKHSVSLCRIFQPEIGW